MMTHRKLLTVGAAIALVACNPDSLTDINRNPNNPEEAPPGPLFTQAARLSAAR